MHICENCGEEHSGSYGSGRFCSIKCARGFSTKAKRNQINIKISKAISDIKKVKRCISCESIDLYSNRSKYCKECKTYSKYINMFDKLDINSDLSIKERNSIAIETLTREYFNNKLSTVDILNKYNIRQNTLFFYFKVNNISLRSIKESSLLNFELGKIGPFSSNTQYLTTYHTTWDNKVVYLRSSYELHEALKYDKNKILYEVESLRISYFDTKAGHKRTCIPDFYLPETNTIVEVKSEYTYDKINMRDKVNAYKDLGYNFKLILDKKEVPL